MPQSKYIIGIDLGTTNSTVAYTTAIPEDTDKPVIHQGAIHQAALSHVQKVEKTLPSFIYFPLPEELASQTATLEWDGGRLFTIGAYAKERGSQLPSRLIASAKSWLCHNGIDRHENILPLETDDHKIKMSPLSACSEMLRHIRESWDYQNSEDLFINQQILVTVPASFDPAARQLVQEAAGIAGYPDIVLLEEPQAAFYAWLHNHSETWRDQLKVGDTVLVVDIGGGTTDFSLIRVEEEEGNLTLKREAVGPHLLLGGDNLDLALAYSAKGKLEDEGHSIDHWQLQGLVHQCRQAKEKLLGDNPPASVDLTILGRGSKLIGNTLTTVLTLGEIQRLVIDGFVPLVGVEERPLVEKRLGIQQVGLPYVQDPRISCHLASFLSMNGDLSIPSAILFNGGTFKAGALRKQLLDLLNHWATILKKTAVRELPEADYDFAVSRGAAFYGLARTGKAVRIRGGVSHSYFVGIEEAAPAVPGVSPPLRAVCIVPFGMEEGEENELVDQEFALLLGEQATFRFFQKSDNSEFQVGEIVRHWKNELTELHPIETILEKGEGDGKTVRVKLKSKVTELGVLELWCVAGDGRKWKLEFETRTAVKSK